MASASKNARKGLFDLPNELVALVVDELADHHQRPESHLALTSFRATCKSALHAAEFAFWKRISLNGKTDRDQLDTYLVASRARALYVQTLDIRESMQPFRDIGIDRFMLDLNGSLRFITRFPNLRHLTLVEHNMNTEGREWTQSLNHQLQRHSFLELRECRLEISIHQRCPRIALSIEGLLQAPKLERLSLQGADLVGSQQSGSSRSSPLRKLKLFECLVSKRSLSWLLSKPTRLDKLTFGQLRTPKPKLGDRLTERVEPSEMIATTQMVLRVLADSQPDLTALTMLLDSSFLRPGDEMLESEQHKNNFDFTSFECLRRLCFWARPSGLYHNTYRDGGINWNLDPGFDISCMPINVFENLPPNIEHIKIKGKGWKWGYDLYGLAEDLLGTDTTPPSSVYIPESLSRLQFEATGQDHRYPLTEEAQNKNADLHVGIDRLMDGLSLQQLEVGQHYYHGSTFMHKKEIIRRNVDLRERKAVRSEGPEYRQEHLAWDEVPPPSPRLPRSDTIPDFMQSEPEWDR